MARKHQPQRFVSNRMIIQLGSYAAIDCRRISYNHGILGWVLKAAVPQIEHRCFMEDSGNVFRWSSTQFSLARIKPVRFVYTYVSLVQFSFFKLTSDWLRPFHFNSVHFTSLHFTSLHFHSIQVNMIRFDSFTIAAVLSDPTRLDSSQILSMNSILFIFL